MHASGNWMLLAQEEREGIDLILPETAELIWGAICFAVVFLVLSRIAFPRLRDAIQKREKSIQEDNEKAESARREANEALEKHKKQLAETRSEADRMIEDARRKAEEVRKDLIEKAEKDAESVVQRAQEQIGAERTRAIQELQGTIADLSIELAEKVVGRSIDAEAQRELVDAYIREVSDMGGNGSRSN